MTKPQASLEERAMPARQINCQHRPTGDPGCSAQQVDFEAERADLCEQVDDSEFR